MYPLAWKIEWLRRIGVAECIDTVACSTVEGAQKPDRRIYLHALERLGVAPVRAARGRLSPNHSAGWSKSNAAVRSAAAASRVPSGSRCQRVSMNFKMLVV